MNIFKNIMNTFEKTLDEKNFGEKNFCIIPRLDDIKSINPENLEMFTRKPRGNCAPLDVTRVNVEYILGGNFDATAPLHKNMEIEKRMNIDGNGALILRYKRENSQDYPASILGFDYENGEIFINQLQGAHKKVAYRINACLEIVPTFLYILEEIFFKVGIPVQSDMNNFRKQCLHYELSQTTETVYKQLHEGIQMLRKKYHFNN